MFKQYPWTNLKSINFVGFAYKGHILFIPFISIVIMEGKSRFKLEEVLQLSTSQLCY